MTTVDEEILGEGLDDWVPLLAVYGMSKLRQPTASPEVHLQVLRDAVSRLVSAGLVDVGRIDAQGFTAWPGSSVEVLHRLDAMLRTTGEDEWGTGIWLRNTDAGSRAARGFGAP